MSCRAARARTGGPNKGLGHSANSNSRVSDAPPPSKILARLENSPIHVNQPVLLLLLPPPI